MQRSHIWSLINSSFVKASFALCLCIVSRWHYPWITIYRQNSEKLLLFNLPKSFPVVLVSFCWCDKCHSQKQFSGGKGLFQLTSYRPSLRKIMAETQAEILENFCLIVFGKLVYTTQNYLPRAGATNVSYTQLTLPTILLV